MEKEEVDRRRGGKTGMDFGSSTTATENRTR